MHGLSLKGPEGMTMTARPLVVVMAGAVVLPRVVTAAQRTSKTPSGHFCNWDQDHMEEAPDQEGRPT